MTTKEERIIMRISTLLSALVMMATFQPVQAEILAEAQVGIKIPLTQKPSTRPMTVAYIPGIKL